MRAIKLLFGALVLLPKLLAVSADETHANFHWTKCPTDAEADGCLKVDFPADKSDDTALLNYVDGHKTIFSGHLKKDASQAISVTVYEDHMEITLHSKHDDGHSMYKVDLDSGKTTVVTMPDDITFDEGPVAPDDINNGTMEDNDLTRNTIERRSIPGRGYNLRVAVFYDNHFKNYAGGSTSAAETKIDSIFNHVKTIFSQFTVSGVTGAIVPSLHSKTHKAAYWSADGSLRACSWIANILQWDVDEHVCLTYQGNARGIVGMAWVRSTCSIYQYYRSNINEYYHTDTITAQIVAHEIGHNLGMFHDFGSGRSTRYEGGQRCTNIGGYMDYTTSPTRWSPCSVGDFSRYHSAVGRYRPNDGYRPTYPFCLKEAPAATPPSTCVPDCVTAWTQAAPSCINKTDVCTEACSKGTCT